MEPRIVASAGLALTAAGLCLLAFAGKGTTICFIIAALVIVGSGFGVYCSTGVLASLARGDVRDRVSA